jgi:hypothetical protein
LSSGLGQPEVGQIGVALVLDQHIGGLDVAMDQPARVGGLQAGGDLRDEPGREYGIESTADADEGLEVCALHVIHRDEEHVSLFARTVDRDDVGVPDRCRPPRLTLEALAELRLLSQLGNDHLERHDAVEVEIARAVHDSHAAAPDDRLEPMTCDFGPDVDLRHWTFIQLVLAASARRAGRARHVEEERFDSFDPLSGLVGGQPGLLVEAVLVPALGA